MLRTHRAVLEGLWVPAAGADPALLLSGRGSGAPTGDPGTVPARLLTPQPRELQGRRGLVPK